MSDDSTALSITRFIAARPAKVWEVMADRQNEWWCPAPWRAEVDRQDRRPGGVCKLTMYGPNGEVEPQNGLYLAFEEGRRFITTDAVVDDFRPAGPFMIGIWEIAPEGTGTRYTATARHWTKEACRQHADMGFLDGWGACADQLTAICEAEAG
jgi:uncharacterized protein YndB with AHSA1/START domain